MPRRELGGYNYRNLMEWAADGEGEDIDSITEALILLVTKQPEDAAKVLQKISERLNKRKTMHTLLQADKVIEAEKLIWGIKTLLEDKNRENDK